MKVTLGIIAIILSIIAHIPYILDIIKKKTTPHLFTWLIWSFVTLIAFLGQWITGGGAGSWSTGVTGLFTVLIFFLCLKYGSKDITFSDKTYLVLSLAAIGLWVVTKELLPSVVLATIIDIFAYMPTIRKTIKDYKSETFIMYPLNTIRHGLSIAALSKYSITTYLYPLVLVIMNLIMTAIIIRKNRKQQ